MTQLFLSDGGFDNAPPSFVFLLIGLFLYLIPTMVAANRKVPNVGSVIVINLFLGWTFVGWVVALAMAMRSR
ncbi:superinfection immunity protein [Mycolicibacterium sp. CBMA 226]|uniref:superinfection immunity protein n=1 Tax=Mycolicibacterium sp. CBMA 226 TaxID=2606611 RepID=UPI001AA159F8|nr:superinfection immunity protein [Mycolicibacterium sp. CBMA 226]